MADEAYQIGTGPSPAESYLRGEEVRNPLIIVPTSITSFFFSDFKFNETNQLLLLDS